MASPQKKKGLGKGLGALIGGTPTAHLDAPAPRETPPPVAPATLSDGSRLVLIDPSTIEPNPKQPRRMFNEEALSELCESIRRDGVQEPVIVRERDGKFELVSGERRVRASIMAGKDTVPAVVRDISDDELLKLGLIENLQREDLNSIETALAYQGLIEQFSWTQEQLADEVGKKRATVTNTLRLLNLVEPVQELVATGQLSMGHARALLAVEDPVAQHALARKAVEQGLSVRDIEKLAAERKKGASGGGIAPAHRKDPNIEQLESELRRSLGTKVTLRTQEGGKGRIEIEYYNFDDLDRLLSKLQR